MRQTLKVAVAMNGGSEPCRLDRRERRSELYRCQRKQGTYRRLQDLLECDVEVDVVTGSSAGGLNGALLGTAIAQDLPPESFDSLDRSGCRSATSRPCCATPCTAIRLHCSWETTSFFPRSNASSEVGCPLEARRPGEASSSISRQRRWSQQCEGTATDSGPSRVSPSRAAIFSFSGSDFTDATTPAAREVGAASGDSGASQRIVSRRVRTGLRPNQGTVPANSKREPTAAVDMKNYASFDTSRWVTDGGVLVNKPVGPAIDLIQRKPVGRNERSASVRHSRPGVRASEEAADLGSPPTLATVVTKALLTLPRAESISADLQAMRAHNRLVHRQHNSRLISSWMNGCGRACARWATTDCGSWPCICIRSGSCGATDAVPTSESTISRGSDGDREPKVRGTSYTWKEVIEALTKLRPRQRISSDKHRRVRRSRSRSRRGLWQQLPGMAVRTPDPDLCVRVPAGRRLRRTS